MSSQCQGPHQEQNPLEIGDLYPPAIHIRFTPLSTDYKRYLVFNLDSQVNNDAEDQKLVK